MKDLRGFQLEYKPYQVLCRAGEESSDLYFLQSGKLLACAVSGTKVTALARIMPGQFVGELSFFDGELRASHVIALERSALIIISKDEIFPALPKWYVEHAKELTSKLRQLDQIVHESNLRKFASQGEKPLTIDEQRYILQALNQKD